MKTECYADITAPRWGPEEREYQILPSKKEYVYGTGRNNALVHKINHIRLRWWECGPGGHYLVRLQSPRMMAITNCGCWLSISGTKAKTCDLPKPDAVLCAACHGKGRNFPRGREHEVPLELAKVRLGCIRG